MKNLVFVLMTLFLLIGCQPEVKTEYVYTERPVYYEKKPDCPTEFDYNLDPTKVIQQDQIFLTKTPTLFIHKNCEGLEIKRC